MKVTENLNTLTTTQSNLARCLGLSVPRVNQMIELGIVVRDESDPSGGVFVMRSAKNYWDAKRKTSDDGNDADFWAEKARHEKAKRQLAEIKLAKEEARIYDAGVVEQVMIEQLIGLRTHLTSLGNKLAAQLAGKSAEEIAAAIDAEVEDRLKELSEYKPELFRAE